jgi:multidrug transporter EmrE-like cation transporter
MTFQAVASVTAATGSADIRLPRFYKIPRKYARPSLRTLRVVGFASFALGARDGIAVSAVLASEFGAVAALAAFVLFRERVVRLQVVGIAAIATGVAVLSALQA